ncbi:MAG: MBOAT family protein [Flavobacteriales bacterium]|nr:MBOAT family protein [Flavobacteriales bacterium]
MLFNSIDFALFLPVVFALYWFVFQRSLKAQNLLIVVASYVFYGWWDWRFLSLIAFSTLLDFGIGLMLGREERAARRKLLLAASIIVNLGFLGFFKYYNFFLDNFIAAFTVMGMPIKVGMLHIVLPVGISFYTFQTLSYSIDVYCRKLEPSKDPMAFAAFVCFFPQLVAGPIERATNLLPQFFRPRIFERAKAVDGLRQMLWGMFKKVVIADNCAEYANLIFNNSSDYSGSTLALGAVLFAFQIYGDFSGYSDIAIGCSRLFGFDLMRNFAFPYFSRDIAEFWRRWHISLSTWFRDYLYIPLGGSRGGARTKVRNTFIIFLVSGFWHGANWTFIAWGLLHALFFLPLLLASRNRDNLTPVALGRVMPSFGELRRMLGTFAMVCVAWVFFRAEDLGHATRYIADMGTGLLAKAGYVETYNLIYWDLGYSIPALIAFLLVIEWKGRLDRHALEFFGFLSPRVVRWAFYSFIILLIGLFVPSGESPFIYFQF